MMSQQCNSTQILSDCVGTVTEKSLVAGQDDPQVIKFDWDNQWLKGEEYYHILSNAALYARTFDFEKYSSKAHPYSIYSEPKNGAIYFVEGLTTGADFGFPRITSKKLFRWKKMNFSTDLPKGNPLVTYIVASAVKAAKRGRISSKEANKFPCFRMHAVMLKNKRSQAMLNEGKGLILCHVRKADGYTGNCKLETKRKQLEPSAKTGSTRTNNGIFSATHNETAIAKESTTIAKKPYSLLTDESKRTSVFDARANAVLSAKWEHCYFPLSRKLISKIARHKNESYAKLLTRLYTGIP